MNRRLKEFFEYWNRLIKEGKVSRLSSMEYYILLIYDDWLVKERGLRND